MKIYVSSSVIVKLDEYVEFLMRTCHYNIDEAEIRRWEIEFQVNQQCNPILMKSGSSGTLKFKSVLQRQEIERFVNNRSQLMRIIKRRRGNRGNTQWIVNYIVSNQGNVYITAIKCYNTFSESLTYKGLQQLINECVDRCLRKYLNKEEIALNESKSRQEKEQMLIDLYNYLSQEPTDDIYDGGQYGKGHLNTKYKAYNYFEPKGIVHNVWAIHYTNLEGYEGIQSRGFRIGVSDYDALAYSQGYYNYEPPRKSGWNFALPIDNKYLGDDLGYGDCGFVIKTDGVRAYHKGDQDDEIIFKGCMVKKKIPFVYDEDYCCWILSGFGYNYKGQKLPNGAYYDEELEQVVFEDIYSLIQCAIST